ncbi:MBL fold metallo-hydrolase [Treponema primitia]|uniref:MBL fold metallo-hydrolase n=1 Tax=Treponema primitia TaxID=88058 RepID=UPI00025550E3|nr:MBL fold metallo-hydrolase [Treponema primitia]
MVNTNHGVHKITSHTWLIDEFGLDTQYLLEGTERSLLIDTGTGVADLRALVEKLTGKPYDVAATHGHNDHTGGCIQFPQLFIHPDDIAMVNPTLENKQDYAAKILERYGAGDRPGFSLSDIVDGPLPKMIPICGGHTFDLGDRIIETLEVPGHTAGSIVFLDRKNHLLFSGDALNPIFLLWIDAPSPVDAARIFLGKAKQIAAMRRDGAFEAMYGGHCDKDPLDPQVLPDLIACAEGIIDGSISKKHKKIHIFDAPFYSFGLADILMDK